MPNDKQRLVELLQEADKKVQEYILENDHMDWIPKLNELSEVRADYLLANGVIVPPCKVGDKVWTKYGYTFEVEKIEILKDKKIFRCGNPGTDDYMAFFEDEIGKDVFLTKEEAEKALVTDNNVGSKMEEGVQE